MQEIIESHIADYRRLLENIDPAAEAPRRRGRPPKVAAAPPVLLLAAPEAPGRRGRPPKALAAPVAAEAPRSRMTEAGRKALSEAMKARWRKVKQGKKTAAPAGLSKRGKAVTDPYWSRLTPEERKAEMARRIAKRKAGTASLTMKRRTAAA